jgi:SAM-dependent methyltransferase
MPAAALERRESDDAYSAWEYETGRRISTEHFGAESVRGLRVLDAACGPAGKTAWYAEAGAALVLGIDLDRGFLAQGRRFAAGRGAADRVRFAVADATRLPARDGAFDAVTANDCMEHFADPRAALHELSRVLRPAGRLYVTFPPYYSAWGAHLYDHVRIPWCQLLMPRAVLHGVVERAVADAERRAGGADAAERARARAREAIAFFETQLNRMSIRRFVALVRAEPRVRFRRLTCVPLKSRVLGVLTALPLVRELFTGLVVAELERVA